MSIGDLTSSGAIPALEAAVRFAAQRHTLITHNIANLSTPDFIPLDVSVPKFQQNLREAIEARRGRSAGQFGELPLKDSDEVRVSPGGSLSLHPRSPSGNVLFRDRNNRDLERNMQDLVENTTAFRVASDLLRNRFDVLRMAISERV